MTKTMYKKAIDILEEAGWYYRSEMFSDKDAIWVTNDSRA